MIKLICFASLLVVTGSGYAQSQLQPPSQSTSPTQVQWQSQSDLQTPSKAKVAVQPPNQSLSQPQSGPLSQTPAQSQSSAPSQKQMQVDSQVQGQQKSRPQIPLQKLPPCPYFGVQTNCSNTAGQQNLNAPSTANGSQPAAHTIVNDNVTDNGILKSSMPGGNKLPVNQNSISNGRPANLSEASLASVRTRAKNYDDGSPPAHGAAPHSMPPKASAIPKSQRATTRPGSTETKKKVVNCVLVENREICR